MIPLDFFARVRFSDFFRTCQIFWFFSVVHSTIIPFVSFGWIGFSYEHFRGWFDSFSHRLKVRLDVGQAPIYIYPDVYVRTCNRDDSPGEKSGFVDGNDGTRYYILRDTRAMKNASGLYYRRQRCIGWDYNNSRHCVQFQSACLDKSGMYR